MSTYFTSWNKEDVVNVFIVAVTVSSGVLTPATKKRQLFETYAIRLVLMFLIKTVPFRKLFYRRISASKCID